MNKKPLFEIGTHVRVKGTAAEFIVNSVELYVGVFMYSAKGYEAFEEKDLEKVVPKATFYIWVNVADGRPYERLLDSEGRNIRGQQINVKSMRRIEGTGVELELREALSRATKTSKVVDEDEDNEWE